MHKYPIFGQRQGIVNVHDACMMVYHCIKHEQIPLNHLTYMTTNIQNLWNNGHKYYILALRVKVYFTYIKVLWWLITVSNMTKINPFFSEILQQDITFKKNIVITQIWYRAKCYFTYISNTWCLITVPNMTKIINPFFSKKHVSQ